MVQHYVHLAENAGLETAERFLRCAEESFRELARYPAMGVRLPLGRATGIRKWQVKGFESFLVFYLARQDGVSIVRVLHAAQDWWRVVGLI
jgi:toxin ParE1/3/4